MMGASGPSPVGCAGLWLTLMATATAALHAGGCSRRGGMPPAYEVTGSVTVEGEPLVEGAISFDPADGKGSVYGGLIRNGAYSVKAAAGPKLVRILGMKKLGAVGPDGQPMASQFLPPRYNTKTEIKAVVEPKRNDLSFELKTEK
jgi:hypothetical protein